MSRILNLPEFARITVDNATKLDLFTTLTSAPYSWDLSHLKTLIIQNEGDNAIWMARTETNAAANNAHAFALEAKSGGAGSGGSIELDVERQPANGKIWLISETAAGTIQVIAGFGL